MEQIAQTSFVGTAEQVATKLHALYESLCLDELVVVTWTHNPEVRKRSYELLAQEMI